MPDAARGRLGNTIDERDGQANTRIAAKYMYLGWTTKRWYVSTKGITRYIQLFFDFLCLIKKKNQSASWGYSVINDCNHPGSKLTNPLSNAQKMGFQKVVEIGFDMNRLSGDSIFKVLQRRHSRGSVFSRPVKLI